MPRSMQARMMPRTASTPRAWPATRGIRRFLAQRPLPSMMMATCRGTAPTSGISLVELVKRPFKACSSPETTSDADRTPKGSDLHQLLLLLGEELVDLCDVFVGELLDVFLTAPLFILGDRLVLDPILEVGIGVTP